MIIEIFKGLLKAFLIVNKDYYKYFNVKFSELGHGKLYISIKLIKEKVFMCKLVWIYMNIL